MKFTEVTREFEPGEACPYMRAVHRCNREYLGEEYFDEVCGKFPNCNGRGSGREKRFTVKYRVFEKEPIIKRVIRD